MIIVRDYNLRRSQPSDDATFGKRNTNAVPRPLPALSARTVPPCSPASRRTSARPMPSSPCAVAITGVELHEQLEHRLERVRVDPRPGVDDVERDRVAVGVRGHADRAVGGRVLARVGAQVLEHLREAHRVGRDHPPRLDRFAGQPVVARLAGRAHGVERRMDRGRDRHVLDRELDVPTGDPRHVEQVVDQPAQVLELARRDRAGLARRCAEPRAHRHHANRRRQARHRVAQLVAEHREELVLAPVGLAQRVDREPPLGDVEVRADDPLRQARRVALDDAPAGEHPNPVAVLAAQPVLALVERGAAIQVRAHQRVRTLEVLGTHPLAPRVDPGCDLVGGVAE
jgi:hypothetical protein